MYYNIKSENITFFIIYRVFVGAPAVADKIANNKTYLSIKIIFSIYNTHYAYDLLFMTYIYFIRFIIDYRQIAVVDTTCPLQC